MKQFDRLAVDVEYHANNIWTIIDCAQKKNVFYSCLMKNWVSILCQLNNPWRRISEHLVLMNSHMLQLTHFHIKSHCMKSMFFVIVMNTHFRLKIHQKWENRGFVYEKNDFINAFCPHCFQAIILQKIIVCWEIFYDNNENWFKRLNWIIYF